MRAMGRVPSEVVWINVDVNIDEELFTMYDYT